MSEPAVWAEVCKPQYCPVVPPLLLRAQGFETVQESEVVRSKSARKHWS